MKFPNHILLDVNNAKILNSSQYWTFKYLFFLNSKSLTYDSLAFNYKFLFNKPNFNFLFLNKQKQFTLAYQHGSRFAVFNSNKNFNKTFFLFNKASTIKHPFNPLNILKKTVFKSQVFFKKTNLLWTLFDINFLRKEKMYTKLKYSRVPQYDIVSGGVAALFSGFLGFLICEKFGFELVDSGDFYVLFMYLVFISFAVRPFLKITSNEKLSWNAFSYKWLLLFYRNVVIMLFNKIKK